MHPHVQTTKGSLKGQREMHDALKERLLTAVLQEVCFGIKTIKPLDEYRTNNKLNKKT